MRSNRNVATRSKCFFLLRTVLLFAMLDASCAAQSDSGGTLGFISLIRYSREVSPEIAERLNRSSLDLTRVSIYEERADEGIELRYQDRVPDELSEALFNNDAQSARETLRRICDERHLDGVFTMFLNNVGDAHEIVSVLYVHPSSGDLRVENQSSPINFERESFSPGLDPAERFVEPAKRAVIRNLRRLQFRRKPLPPPRPVERPN